MEVNRLLSDELVYELTVRGLPVRNTVIENRATLRGALRLEREGMSSGVNWNICLPAEEELNICFQKLETLGTEVRNLNHSNRENEYKRIFSRLCHVQDRLRRITVMDSGMAHRRDDLLGLCLGQIDTLSDTVQGNHGKTATVERSILDENNRQEGCILDQDNLLLPEVVQTQTINLQNPGRLEDSPNPLIPDLQDADRNSTRVPQEYFGGNTPPRNGIEEGNQHMEGMTYSYNPLFERRTTTIRNPYEFERRTDQEPLAGIHSLNRREDVPQFSRTNQMSDGNKDEVQALQRRLRELLGPSYTPQEPKEQVNSQPTHGYPYNLEQSILKPATPQVNQIQTSVGTSNLFPRGGSDTSRSFVDVSRWKIQFDGESSVTNFLERIEELRISRGVSKEQLLSSAPELFTNEALIWFRIQNFKTWDDLTKSLRESFQPYDYEFDLLEEIRRRTQGSRERVITYIAAMENLFNKLGSSKPTELTRVKLIRRNLLPYLQTQLALYNIETIPQLISLCRAVEETSVRTQKYVPPPTNYRQLLEPELAYHKPTGSITYGPQISEIQVVNSERHEQIPRENEVGEVRTNCWNCGRTGHKFRKCKEKKRTFCFRCGNSGVIASSCPRCQTKNSNPGTQ